MYLRILASSFLLSLLPGCMESGYLVTNLAGDPAAAVRPAQGAGLRYTNHRPAAIAEVAWRRSDSSWPVMKPTGTMRNFFAAFSRRWRARLARRTVALGTEVAARVQLLMRCSGWSENS